MELRQLRSFTVLAEELHFGRAARRLNIVQPALSKQIKLLEEELGGPLLRRGSRRVALTEAGRLFLVEARCVLAHAATAAEIVRRALRGEVGRVRIGYSASAIHSGVLSRAVALLEAARPGVEIAIDRVDPWQQTGRLLAGEVDIIFGPRPIKALPPELTAADVERLPVCIALSSSHRLAAAAAINAADLGEEAFVEYAASEREGHGIVERLLGFRPRIVLTEPDPLTVLAMVEAGRGISVLPSALAQHDFPRIVYRPLAAQAQPLIIAMINARGPVDPFLATILAVFRQGLVASAIADRA